MSCTVRKLNPSIYPFRTVATKSGSTHSENMHSKFLVGVVITLIHHTSQCQSIPRYVTPLDDDDLSVCPLYL